MSQRVVVDPVTRIEGHLRVEAQVADGRVTDAWSSGTMWRGIEKVLIGRDPREAWLFAQRICGVCTTVHALASVRAVEDAGQQVATVVRTAHSLSPWAGLGLMCLFTALILAASFFRLNRQDA